MKQVQIYIFAAKSRNGEYVPDEIINDLEEWYSDIEYGDVKEGSYQLWEYPSGKIFQIVPDRELDAKQYYATPHSNDGVIWKPRLNEIGLDAQMVSVAYDELAREST